MTRTSRLARLTGIGLTVAALQLPVSPASAATTTLDQSFEDLTATGDLVDDATTTLYRAQTFTAGITGELSRIDLPLEYVSGGSLLTIQIRQLATNGSPDGTLLASKQLTSLDDAAGWDEIDFASPAMVTAGDQYAIVAIVADVHWNWYGSNDIDEYVGGDAWYSLDRDPWVMSTADLSFHTYVTTYAADLAVSVSGPSTARTKGTITYLLTVTNHGPDMAKDVVLTDNLPYGTQYTAYSANQGSCTRPAKGVTTVTCHLGDLADGSSTGSALTVKITARTGSGNLNDVATVSGSVTDPDPTNNSASLSTAVTR